MKKYKKNNRIITILLTVLVKLKVISGKILLNRFSKKLLVDLNLTGISKAIFTEKYREIDHTNIFSEKLIDKKKILDLGANIGYYMLLESEHADKDAKIICIEPDPRNTYLLKENIRINNLEDKTEVLEAAVSGEDGEISISFTNASNLNRITDEKNLNYESTKIKSISLNTIFNSYGYFDCLRMDVEGAESVILGKNSNLFLQSMPVGSLIFMEVHPANYIDGDNMMITGLKNLLNFGFEKFSIVTSGVSPNQKIFQKLGLSNNLYKDGKYNRFYYENVKFEDLEFLALRTPKIVRYVIAEKKNEN